MAHPYEIKGPTMAHPYEIKGPTMAHPYEIKGPTMSIRTVTQKMISLKFYVFLMP